MIEKIAHIGIAVRDLEESLFFYRDALGLPLHKVQEVPAGGIRAALLGLGETEIELLEPLRPGSGVARFLERRGEGLHHLSLETPDIYAAFSDLKRRGAEIADPEPVRGVNGTVFFLHPRALHGVLVELEQPEGAAAGVGHRSVEQAEARLSRVIVAAPASAEAAAAWRSVLGLRDAVETPSSGPALAVGDAVLEFVAGAERPGLDGLAIEVDDLEGSLTRLRERGVGLSPLRLDDGWSVAEIDPGLTAGVPLRIAQRVE